MNLRPCPAHRGKSESRTAVTFRKLFPGHPNLLRADFEPFSASFVRKPCLGREGANVQIVFDGQEFMQTEGVYQGPYVYQEIFPIPKMDGNFPVLGCWIVGDEACGLGIRESTDLITRNTSRFVPHLFTPAATASPSLSERT